MIAGQPPVPPGPAPGRSSAPLVGAAGRYRYLDNLKVVLIASVIGLHGVLGYIGTLDAWSYTGVREVTLSPVVEAARIVVVAVFGVVGSFALGWVLVTRVRGLARVL